MAFLTMIKNLPPSSSTRRFFRKGSIMSADFILEENECIITIYLCMYPESRVRRAMLVLSPWPSTEYSCCSRAAAEESSSTVKLSQEGSVSACLHTGARWLLQVITHVT